MRSLRWFSQKGERDKREEDHMTEEEHLGGFFVTQENITRFSGLKPGEEHITLNVQKQNERDLYCRIGKNVKLGLLIKDYCDRKGLVDLRFTYDGTGVGVNLTPEELKMEDGDIIDVWTEQLGA